MKTRQRAERTIAIIDSLIDKQLLAIRLHQQFELLQGAWKGLHSLLKFSMVTTQDPLIQFKLMNLSLHEISKSILEKLLSEQSFQQPGCYPFSIILGDYYFNKTKSQLLADIASVVSTVFSPFITSQQFPTECITKSEFIKTLSPSVIMGDKHQTKINGIYLYAKQIIHSFANTHWFYAINSFKIKTPHYPETEYSCKHNTLHKHRHRSLYGTFNDPQHKFEHILAVSRFAHYIKILLRNKIGGYYTHEQCQQYLQNWLHQYCAAHDKTIRYPLLRANIKIDKHCTLNITPYFNEHSYNKTIRFKTDD